MLTKDRVSSANGVFVTLWPWRPLLGSQIGPPPGTLIPVLPCFPVECVANNWKCFSGSPLAKCLRAVAGAKAQAVAGAKMKDGVESCTHTHTHIHGYDAKTMIHTNHDGMQTPPGRREAAPRTQRERERTQWRTRAPLAAKLCWSSPRDVDAAAAAADGQLKAKRAVKVL